MPEKEQATIAPGREHNRVGGVETEAVMRVSNSAIEHEGSIATPNQRSAEESDHLERPRGYRGRHVKMSGLLRLLTRH